MKIYVTGDLSYIGHHSAYKFTQVFNTIEDVDLQIKFVPFAS